MTTQNPHDWNQTIQILLDFLSGDLWKIIILLLLLAFRKQLGGFIERLIKANFSYRNASGSVEAVAPVEPLQREQLAPASEKSMPSDEDDETEPTEEDE